MSWADVCGKGIHVHCLLCLHVPEEPSWQDPSQWNPDRGCGSETLRTDIVWHGTQHQIQSQTQRKPQLSNAHQFPGRHYAFQAAQRLSIARCQEMCRRTGDDWRQTQHPESNSAQTQHIRHTFQDEFDMMVSQVSVHRQVWPEQNNFALCPWSASQLKILNCVFIRFRARSSQGWPRNCSRGMAALLWGWWAFILLAPNAAWMHDGCSSMWKRGRLLYRPGSSSEARILSDDDTGKYIPRRRFAGNHVDKADSQDSCQRRPTSKLFVRWRGQHSKRDEEHNCDLLGNFHVGKSSRHCAVGHGVPVPPCRAHPRIAGPVLFTFDHCLKRKNVLHNGRDGRHINFMSQGLQGQLVPPRIHLQVCSSQNAFWHWGSQIPECARIATLRGLIRFVGEVEAVCFGWNLVPAAFGGWVWSPWCICSCKASLGGSWVRWVGERQASQLLEQAWALAWLFIVDSKEVVTENPRTIYLLMLRNRRWLHLASPRKSNWPSCDHMWMHWMPAHLWQLGPQLNLNDWPHTELDWDEFHG